jgi:hypothetical protein
MPMHSGTDSSALEEAAKWHHHLRVCHSCRLSRGCVYGSVISMLVARWCQQAGCHLAAAVAAAVAPYTAFTQATVSHKTTDNASRYLRKQDF